MSPLFSFIIPIYNVEAYLHDCLNSILNQTYSNFECILINDNSNDNSELICKEYLCDLRFKYFKLKNNKGLSFARNYGIKKAQGFYILFIDSDDIISSNYLQFLSENLHDNSIPIFNIKCFKDGENLPKNEFFDKWHDISNVDLLNLWFDLYHYQDFNKLDYEFITVYSKVYPRNIFSNLKFKKMMRLHEDNYFFFCLVKKCKCFSLNRSCFYFHRIRNNSIMTSNKPHHLKYLLINQIIEILVSYNLLRNKKLFNNQLSSLKKLFYYYISNEKKILNACRILNHVRFVFFFKDIFFCFPLRWFLYKKVKKSYYYFFSLIFYNISKI